MNVVVQSLTTRFGNSGVDFPDAEAGWVVAVEDETVPSVTSHYGKGPDSDATDPLVVSAPVTAKWAKGNGGPAGDEAQNLTVTAIQDGREMEKDQNGLGISEEGVAYTVDTTGAQAAFVKRHGASTTEDHEIWDEGDIARTLNGVGQAGANGALVARAFHAYHGYEQTDGVQTLLGGASKGCLSLHDAPVLVEPPEAFNVVPVNARSGEVDVSEAEVAGALTAVGEQRKAERGTRVARGGDVRRLTPTECERLQGLPDGWTYPWGESLAHLRFAPQGAAGRARACPVDYPPDGPRYAACGDAVTATVSEWIGRRIMAVE